MALARLANHPSTRPANCPRGLGPYGTRVVYPGCVRVVCVSRSAKFGTLKKGEKPATAVNGRRPRTHSPPHQPACRGSHAPGRADRLMLMLLGQHAMPARG